MKTFRNVVIALGLLLLLYVGAYWGFARTDMRFGYFRWGRSYSADIKWSDWRKCFVPIASLDHRVNFELPLWKRDVGHWTSADSDDFVTLDREGQCSFRIGEFQHSGEAGCVFYTIYMMDFERDGRPYGFSFSAEDESGKATARIWYQKLDTEDGVPTTIGLTSATLTRTKAPN